MDAIKNAAENKLGKDSQPGDNVERSADNAVNQGTTSRPFVASHDPLIPFCCHSTHTDSTATEVDSLAGQAGVPGSADNTINEAVDTKVNDDIPGGN